MRARGAEGTCCCGADASRRSLPLQSGPARRARDAVRSRTAADATHGHAKRHFFFGQLRRHSFDKYSHRVHAIESTKARTMANQFQPAIDDALANPAIELDRLKMLREHAAAVVAAQANLKSALSKLDREIERREKKVGDRGVRA